MKFGVATSIILHAALLGWGLLNLSVPDVQQIELTGVEIDFETSEASTPAAGKKEANVSNRPAPTSTRKPEKNPDAQNFGDAKTDKKSDAKAKSAERAVEKTATAIEPDQAVKKPDPVPALRPENQPTPATKLSSINDPAVPITPDLPSEAAPEQSEAAYQLAIIPSTLPTPNLKPSPPKPNTAKTRKRKQPEHEPSRKTTDAKKSKQPDVGDLIKNNKTVEAAASGGQKKSVRSASLGMNTSNFAKRLSKREEDQIISRISRCSTGQAGQRISDDLKVTIVLELYPDGNFKIQPKGKANGGTAAERRRFTREALRYSIRCAPYDFLPREKYETWKEIVVTFHPSKMFE